MKNNSEVIFETENLCKYFDLGHGAMLHAVDKVNLKVYKGETLGLVGESGCGKTTLGRVLVRMYDQTSGIYKYNNEVISNSLAYKDRRAFSRKVQMIFQDPFTSLNPRMTVGDIISEGPTIHNLWTAQEKGKKIDYWLNRVGLVPEHAARFPHEFSGGQRQRIGIARALALEPQFVVCDEPISALDVSVGAQVVTLLQELQRDFGLTYVFIAHGLHMVRYISNRMAVMYLGEIVELANSADLFKRPLHPYSEALISSNPIPDPDREKVRERKLLSGEISSPVNPKPCCRFGVRCNFATDICKKETPKLREVEPGRHVACHNWVR